MPDTAAPTGARLRVLDALSTTPLTATDVANAAGMGYSTVTAHLRALAGSGHVTKVDDEWRPTDAGRAAVSDAFDPTAPTTPDVAPATEVDAPTETDTTVTDTTTEPTTDADGTEPWDTDDGGAPQADADTPDAPAPAGWDVIEGGTDAAAYADEAPTADPTPEPAEATPDAGTTEAPARTRAAFKRGYLREQVTAYVMAHPGEELKPGQIQKALDVPSAGAVMEVLKRLTTAGHVTHLTGPHRFVVTQAGIDAAATPDA